MHPLSKYLLKIFILIIALFFLSQPYNWYCQITQNCTSFYFSHLIPKKLGTSNLKTIITTESKFRDVDFIADQNIIQSVANQKKVVKFTIKNNSKKNHYIFPKMEVNPPEAEKYLTKYNSPSSKAYRLNPKEVINIDFEFEFNEELEKNHHNMRLIDMGVQIIFKI